MCTERRLRKNGNLEMRGRGLTAGYFFGRNKVMCMLRGYETLSIS